MATKNRINTSVRSDLSDLRSKLPYQYASIIEKALKARKDSEGLNLTRSQIRLAFYGQIKNPNVVIPVLEETQVLLEKMKKVEELKKAL